MTSKDGKLCFKVLSWHTEEAPGDPGRSRQGADSDAVKHLTIDIEITCAIYALYLSDLTARSSYTTTAETLTTTYNVLRLRPSRRYDIPRSHPPIVPPNCPPAPARSSHPSGTHSNHSTQTLRAPKEITELLEKILTPRRALPLLPVLARSPRLLRHQHLHRRRLRKGEMHARP